MREECTLLYKQGLDKGLFWVFSAIKARVVPTTQEPSGHWRLPSSRTQLDTSRE